MFPQGQEGRSKHEKGRILDGGMGGWGGGPM
jgi:hypothetical protein